MNPLQHDTVALFDRPDFVPSTHGALAHYRAGTGPDVVLVHGWPLSAITFRALVPRLAARFTVHAFDLPGAAHSAAWRGPIDIASDAVALRAALDRLGLRRYALLAHDSGGAIARLVAAADPRVAALVLGNTEIPGHHSAFVRFLASAAHVPGFMRLFVALLGVGAVRRSRIGFGGCFRDADFANGEFARVVLERSFATPAALAGQVAFVRNFDLALIDRLREMHGRVTAPVRLVWGTADPFFPLAHARAMVGQFAGPAELVEIAGAKLFAHEDHPDAFAEHAMPFLVRSLITAPVAEARA